MKITISYKTEEIDTDTFNEKEQAIYQAGVNAGYKQKRKDFSMMLIGIAALVFLIMIICSCSANAQKKTYEGLFNGNSIATYSLCFAGGISDGLNDCVVANKFYYADFWGYADWQKHGNMDGFHATKLATPFFYATAIAINLGEKRNWKYHLAKGLACFAFSRLGHELTYNVIFNKYPK